MKPANIWIRIGRILGIIHIVIFTGIIIYSIILAIPLSEETAPAILVIIVSIVFIAIFGSLLYVAWRREILGGILYLVPVVFLSLFLVSTLIKEENLMGLVVLVPTFFTGVLLLTGGILKKKMVKIG